MIQIREMVLEDFDNIDFIKPIYQLKFVSRELSISQLKNIFENKRLMTDTYILVDTDKNILIGHVCVSIHHSFNNGIIGIVYDTAVHPDYRGQGHGLALMIYARDKCGEKRHLTSFAGPVDSSIAPFYEKVGGTMESTLFSYKYPKKSCKLM